MVHCSLIKIIFVQDYAVRYWLKKGASRNQLVVGIPFYGRSFTLVDAANTKPGSPIKGYGKEGSYTQEKGFLAYFEILQLLEDRLWLTAVDDVGSPYIAKGDQWIGYENPQSIATKVSCSHARNIFGELFIK